MKIIHFWKPLLWLAIICYGLFIPAGNLPTKPFLNIPHFDKIVHFSLFFGLCILLLRPFKKLNMKYYLIAPAISLFLGILLETTQQMITTSRSSDFYDFLANTSGIIVSTLFYYFFVSGKKWEVLF
jgi:VanZ family protein